MSTRPEFKTPVLQKQKNYTKQKKFPLEIVASDFPALVTPE
jgi:predicted transcriptional regulator